MFANEVIVQGVLIVALVLAHTAGVKCRAVFVVDVLSQVSS